MVDLKIPLQPPVKAWNQSIKPGMVNNQGLRLWTMKEHKHLVRLVKEYPKASLSQFLNNVVPMNMNVTPIEAERYLKLVGALSDSVSVATELRKVPKEKGYFGRLDIVKDPSEESVFQSISRRPSRAKKRGPDGMLPSERIALCLRVFELMKHQRLPTSITSFSVRNLWEGHRWGFRRGRESDNGLSYEELARKLEREIGEKAIRILNCLKGLEIYRLKMLAWLLQDSPSLTCLWCSEFHHSLIKFEDHVMADHTAEFSELEDYLVGEESKVGEKMMAIISKKVATVTSMKFKFHPSDEMLSSVDPAPRGEYLLNRAFILREVRPSSSDDSSPSSSSSSSSSSDSSDSSSSSSENTSDESTSSSEDNPSESSHEMEVSAEVIDVPFFAQR